MIGRIRIGRGLPQDARGLDQFSTVQRVGVDKTGTLTKGNFELVDVVVMPKQLEKRDLLKLLAALESQDSHPVANSLVRSYVGCAASFDASASQLPKVCFREGFSDFQ